MTCSRQFFVFLSTRALFVLARCDVLFSLMAVLFLVLGCFINTIIIVYLIIIYIVIIKLLKEINKESLILLDIFSWYKIRLRISHISVASNSFPLVPLR